MWTAAKPALALPAGDLVILTRVGCARARGESRRVADVVPSPTDEVHRRLELGRGLTGKTDDDIGGKRELRVRLAKPVDDFLKLGHGVLPTHRLQNPIGSALHR